MKKQLYLSTLLLLTAAFQVATAQQVPGLQYSNYGGLYRSTYNPSAIGGSHFKWQVNIGSLGGSINSRYFVFLGKNSLLYPLLAPHSTQELYGRSRTMGSLTEKDAVNLVSEIRWPSAMFSVGKYQGFAVQFRTRGFVQGQNIPEPIRNLYFKRLDTGSTPAVANQAWGDFSLVQQSFSEMSVSYGAQLLDLDAHKIRVGATVKRVFGARIGYVSGSAGSFSIRPEVGNTESSVLVVNDLSYQSGYSQVTQQVNLGSLLDAGKYGNGWGYDLGATYELGSFWGRSKEVFDESPEYLIRLAASLTDIGSIRYRTAGSRVVNGQQTEMVIGQKNLEAISDQGPQGFMGLYPGVTDSTFSGNIKLPQAWHLEADIQLVKGFFLNLSQTRRFQGTAATPFDVAQLNSFTITPRFEDEDSDFAFPISFINGNKKASIGAVGHFGPVFLGFSNVNGLIRKGGARGSMVYIGVSAWKLRYNRGGKKSKPGKK